MILWSRPDGGKESGVRAWGIEFKRFFSIILLRFNGERETYHSHAFNAVTLWLYGKVLEEPSNRTFTGGMWKYTPRSAVHRVKGQAWALTFRGPWRDTWIEVDDEVRVLTHGRKVVEVHGAGTSAKR